MPRVRRPKQGSRGFYPRKRARRIYPKIDKWPSGDKALPLGFAGYKAGMTHVGIIDSNPNSRTKGQIVTKPVTVLDCPSMFVFGITGLSSFPKKSLFTIFSDKADKKVLRKFSTGKLIAVEEQLKRIDVHKENLAELRIVVYTNPGFKKTPEIFELPIGGKIDEQIEYVKKVLGTELDITDIYKEGDYIDVSAVTKGKGFTGVVKRFGIVVLGRRDEQGHRHVGCIGQKEPGKVRSTIPRSGQHGFQTRTEVNKRIVKIAEPIEIEGGFLRYGKLSGKMVMVEGSIPGPSKRLIRMRNPVRFFGIKHPTDIRYISERSKQGV